MPNDHGALTPAQQFNVQLDEQVKNFRALLPSHIPVEKFKRVVIVAIAQNPELFKADRRSLFTAAQKCAADGLLPDGRQAALVVYGTQAVYMPMVAGIRQRMRNSGDVLSAEAHVVYRNDKFFQKLGDDPAIVHEPPAFGTDRGEAVGAYAIIKLKNGEVLREVLDKREIEKIRAVSKSKNGPAWTNWWGEMARKSALRRCAKAAPTSADIDELLARDDDAPAPMVDITPPEPEPPRAAAITHEPEQVTDPYRWTVTDCDGEQYDFNRQDSAAEKLRAVFDDAERRGPSHVEAARENNAALIADLGEPSHSPSGIPPTRQQTEEPAAVASQDARQPGGDTMPDLLGGEPRKPAGYYKINRAGNTTDDWLGFEKAAYAMIKNGDPKDGIRRDNADDLRLYEQIEPMRANKLSRALETK